MPDVIMPKAGDAMEEGVIVQWLKKVGDAVTAEDALLEVETDKSNVEVEAGVSGIIQQIKFKAGETVPVGQVIAIIGSEAVAPAAPEAAPTMPAESARETAEAAPAAANPTLPPTVAKSNGTAPSATPAVAPTAAPSVAISVSAPKDFKPYTSFVGAFPVNLGGSASVIGEPLLVDGGDASSTERVKATPVARAMATANNLDLAALRGTGPDGAIGKKDVETALTNGTGAAKAPAAATATAPPALEDDVVVEEYNAMRRTIAKRLAESKSTIPHYYVTTEIDVEALFTLREQLNTGAGENQAKVTVNDFMVKATAVALVENPVMNASFADNKRYTKKSVNIGVAVSVDNGLIVPVVRGCETKSVRQIAKETRPLIEKARSAKLAPADYTGGTFTISNLGSLTPDVENFAAIVNPGEGGILAFSSIRTVPAVVGGAIVARKRMKVTLSADHRVSDGAAGALFLQSLKRIIENPLQILA